MPSIRDRWIAIRKNIETFQSKNHGKTAVTFIAVSKSQSADAILPLLIEGHRDFGENRVQEALVKWAPLKKTYPDIRLHFIGGLQTNKVKEALSLFDVFHTLDRESVVDELLKEIGRLSSRGAKQFFVQVNTGEEAQKGGVDPQALSAFIAYTRNAGLAVDGLMCIPPANEPPAPHFALLRTLAEKHALPCLSMGMSNDYEAALRLGATHIRVGTALFGERIL